MLTKFGQQGRAKRLRGNPRPQPEQLTIKLPELNELIENPLYMRIFEQPVEDVYLDQLRSQLLLVRL